MQMRHITSTQAHLQLLVMKLCTEGMIVNAC